MFSTDRMLLGAMLSLTLSFNLTTISLAQNSSDYVVVSTTINPVTKPQSIGDVIADCSNNILCAGVVDLAASYFGVPPGTVTGAMAAVPKAEHIREDSKFTIELPSGYTYCRTNIQMISITPTKGDRAANMVASSYDRGVSIYTWVPRASVIEIGKRNWIEARFTIQGVRTELAAEAQTAGTCRKPNQRLIDCRGSEGGKGRPACRSMTD